MTEGAARLVDEVLPRVPVRQCWTSAVGLDRSVSRRALGVAAPAAADRLAARQGVRVLRPLGARLTPRASALVRLARLDRARVQRHVVEALRWR